MDWVFMMCQCRFIIYKKRTTLLSYGDSGGGCACVGIGGIQEFLCFLLTIAVNLKNEVYEKQVWP